ncbi:hypothetical protein [Terribacillus sp. DMT04]|uniref:tubby C-terminal domain-like protein n=1 Tax=Terribacillus sp. DMT04 TaxID=2850441 RepID=UPI001C2BD885|nr:hypothetical protein [Terribacillus sp. DMT04]QXE02443.1 hypothetical protein KS242_04270 [Terribacillus sp. DMT04]
MYSYTFRHVQSTKPAAIYDGANNIVGYISRVYPTLFHRIFDYWQEGLVSSIYQVKDKDGKIVFQAKEQFRLLRRTFTIKYRTASDVHELQIKEDTKLHSMKKTSFSLHNDVYVILKKIGDWAVIQRNGKEVARWKHTVKIPPSKVNIELTDPEAEQHLLLWIGLFHTFFHNP